ncbi:hypothetical protein ACHAPJ_013330 [Fusarium lateritium]
MALNGDDRFLATDLREAVLGQTSFAPDQTAFLRSLNGYKEEMSDIKWFEECVTNVTDLDIYLCSSELCKFCALRLESSQAWIRMRSRTPS